MAVTSFATTSAGPLTENVEKKIFAGISTTGKYTFTTELTPGIYSCKTKMLSDSAATPTVALTLSTSGQSVAVPSDTGALFKVTSTESGGTLNSYTSNLSTTEVLESNIYNTDLNTIQKGSYNGDGDYHFRISAYSPSTGVYVGNDPASNAESFKFQKSTDLKTWTNITMPTLSGSAPNQQYYGQIHWLNNQWIYVFFDNNQSRTRYATSTDLENWTYAGQYPQQSYYSSYNMFTYLDGYYYAMIQNGYSFYRSADLATWTQVYSGEVNNSIISNGTTLMANVGSTIIHSSNGTTWTTKSNPNSSGTMMWVAAQPNGDYMFVNTNGASMRYMSDGTLKAYASNFGSYFYLASTHYESAKIAWHVDKFYVVGRWDYSGRYDGLWPTDSGVTVTQNNQLFSYSSTNRSQYKSLFSDGTNLFGMVRVSSQESQNNYWTNYAIVKLVSAMVVQVIYGTTGPMGTMQIGTGKLRIRGYGGGQCRSIEYSFDGGLTWYATILDNNYYGGNLFILYSFFKNVYINSDEQGFVGIVSQSNYLYSIRAVKNGYGFTFSFAYMNGVTNANGGLAKLKEDVFAIGYNNTQMLYSTNNGASWTQTTYQSNNNTGWGFYQGLYNPVDGLYYGFDGATTVTYRTSPNLATWSTSAVAVTGNPGVIFKAHYSPSSKIAVIFGSSFYAYSTDMKTWTKIGDGSYGNNNQVEVASDGMWCISGRDSVFKVSSNGKSFIDIPFVKPSNISGFYLSGYAGGKGFSITSDYAIKTRERLTEPNTIFELYKTSYGEL